MKYFSLDLETTGIERDKCQILQISAYLEDTNNPLPRDKTPCFNAYVSHAFISGDPFALVMNSWILDILAKKTDPDIIHFGDVAQKFHTWVTSVLSSNDIIKLKGGKPKLLLAGKNVGTFDSRFLVRLPKWNDLFEIHHRHLDPSGLYIDWKSDVAPPSFPDLLARAGVVCEKLHDARDDAWAVIEVLRKSYTKETT